MTLSGMVLLLAIFLPLPGIAVIAIELIALTIFIQGIVMHRRASKRAREWEISDGRTPSS